MNIDRLRFNTPILVKIIREEFNLSYKQIAMIFDVKQESVVEWEFDKSRPDEDIVSAMVMAYKWIKFWHPIKLFTRLITNTAVSALKKLVSNIYIFILHLLGKDEQIKLELD